MKTRITLTRKHASIKLESATSATYFMQIGDGDRYSKPVPVPEMVHAFESDPRARLRIRLSDSQHTVTITESSELRTGYDVEFS